MDPEKARSTDSTADEDVEQQTIHNDGHQPKPDEIRPAVVRADSEKTAIPTVNPPPRRKFLARLILGDRPAPDRQFSKKKKLMILATVAIAGTISPVATTIYYPAIVEMQYDLNTTDTAMNASLSVFTFATALFPLMWASFGDKFGRRPVYLVSFLISVIGSICCALSVNVGMLIAFRAVSAIGSSSVMSIGAGTISDLFEAEERGRAFGYYTMGPLLGPALAPIIGGYLSQGLGWRANFWFLAIFAFCIWLCIFLILPETLMKQPKQNDNSGDKPKSRHRPVNPIAPITLLRFPNVALTVSFVGILFFVWYLINTNFTRLYQQQYGLDTGTTGLCYLPLAGGAMVGCVLGGRVSDQNYRRRVAKAKENNQEVYPEMRMGSPLFYGSLFLQLAICIVYGWCLEFNVHYAVGIVMLFFIGFSLMIPNVTMSAYLIDCFRKKGASVTACNNFVRYIMAGIGSLVASDIQRALGSGILYTVCGAALLLFSILLVILRMKGKEWAIKRKEQGYV